MYLYFTLAFIQRPTMEKTFDKDKVKILRNLFSFQFISTILNAWMLNGVYEYDANLRTTYIEFLYVNLILHKEL